MKTFEIRYAVSDFDGVQQVGKIDHSAKSLERAEKNAMELVLGHLEEDKDDDANVDDDPDFSRPTYNLKKISISVLSKP